MTTRPSSGSFSDENYAALSPILQDDEDNNWHAAIYIAGVGVMYQPLHDFIRETPDGSSWSALLDPDRIPAKHLPWLGQWVGVRLNSVPVEPATNERSLVKAHVGFARGTPAAMIAEIKATLTGTQTVFMKERWNGTLSVDAPYHLSIVTHTPETPDPDATLAAILRQKPGGIVLHWEAITGLAWDELIGSWDVQPGTWDSI